MGGGRWERNVHETIRGEERGEEMRESDVRKRNVIMHRVEEAGEEASTYEERRNWDTQKCEEIFTTMKLNPTKDNIKFRRRIGERGEEPRPMVVGLYREHQKEDNLDAVGELRGTPLADIGIMPDLTQEQRRDEADLIQEAVRRNEEMSDEDRAKKLVLEGSRKKRREEAGQRASQGGRQRESEREPERLERRAEREGGAREEGPRSRQREIRREGGSDRVCEGRRPRRSVEDEAGQQEEQRGRRGSGEGQATTTGGQCLREANILYLNAQSIVGK